MPEEDAALGLTGQGALALATDRLEGGCPTLVGACLARGDDMIVLRKEQVKFPEVSMSGYTRDMVLKHNGQYQLARWIT